MPNKRSAPSYDWMGFYLGGQLGLARGSSFWTGPRHQRLEGLDSFDKGGSFFGGLQGGYNGPLPNRVLLRAEAGVSYPS